MTHDELVKELRAALAELPALVRQADSWKTLDVLYEEPRVQRLWMPLNGLRLYLHRIHPCRGKPLYHPHPWPSVVLVVGGRQLMEVGYADTVSATIELSPGSCYTMVHPRAYHSVNPTGGPSLSIMMTGRPWSEVPPLSEEQRSKNVELSDEDKLSLLSDFSVSLPEP